MHPIRPVGPDTMPHPPEIAGSPPMVDLTSRLRSAQLDLPHNFKRALPQDSEELRHALAWLSRGSGETASTFDPLFERDAMLGLLTLAMHELPVKHLPAHRSFVIDALHALGLPCPTGYQEMLNRTPAGEMIPHLAPWFLLSSPAHDAGYCSAAVGRPVLPFCQALEQDLMACFSTHAAENTRIILINPWEEDPEEVVQNVFEDFDAWQKYAGELSALVRAETDFDKRMF